MKSLILRVVPTLIFYSGFVQYFNLIAILYHDFQRSQVLHVASIANDAGVAHNTARAWISVLEASYIVYRLRPHHKNFSKRLIKRPKLYFYDSGLVARLLGIRSREELRLHPLRGSLFESCIVSEVCKWRFHNRQPLPIHFWREHKGKEIDLLIDVGNKIVAVEVKAGQPLIPIFFAIWNITGIWCQAI